MLVVIYELGLLIMLAEVLFFLVYISSLSFVLQLY